MPTSFTCIVYRVILLGWLLARQLAGCWSLDSMIAGPVLVVISFVGLLGWLFHLFFLGWLVCWYVWWVGWLVGWLVGCLVPYCLVSRLFGWLADPLARGCHGKGVCCDEGMCSFTLPLFVMSLLVG